MKLAYMTALTISSLSCAVYAADDNKLQPDIALHRAIIEPAIVQQAIELEKRLSANERRCPGWSVTAGHTQRQ